ncbi:unnamed protein product [Malus baccata var. baccata]
MVRNEKCLPFFTDTNTIYVPRRDTKSQIVWVNAANDPDLLSAFWVHLHTNYTAHIPCDSKAEKYQSFIFNGPGGRYAASIIREHIFNFIVEDPYFTFTINKASRKAFKKGDHAFADIGTPNSSSITSALSVLVLGRKMLIANVGDCLVVMGRRDKEVVLISEDLESSKGSSGPLPAPPKVQEIFLSKEDEFLILAWNDYNICCPHLFTHARKELMVNNDPGRCAREIVRKALYWEWGTNMKDGVAKGRD